MGVQKGAAARPTLPTAGPPAERALHGPPPGPCSSYCLQGDLVQKWCALPSVLRSHSLRYLLHRHAFKALVGMCMNVFLGRGRQTLCRAGTRKAGGWWMRGWWMVDA